MAVAVPKSRPRLSKEELTEKISTFRIDRNEYPVIVVGIRGYYKEMGIPGEDDRGIYDDAIFLDSLSVTAAYNGNTNPAAFRKGIAELKPGAWFVHQFDNHVGLKASKSPDPEIRKGYLALCQRAGPVTVMRGGRIGETTATGINIHKGAHNSVSSIGCQTIYPDQWLSFIETAVGEARRYLGGGFRKKVIPYVLLSE